MVSRETAFRFGGAVAVALGVLLAVGLAWAGIGWVFLNAWLAAAFSILIGAFFVKVADDERRFRSAYLRAVERGQPPPPGGPPL